MRVVLLITAMFFTGLCLGQVEDEEVKSKKESSPRKNSEVVAPASVREAEPSVFADQAVSQQSMQLSANSKSFKASKFQSNNQRTQRSPQPEQQQRMDDAVQYFAGNAPNSFEYHFYAYSAGNHDVSLKEHLRLAEEINPNSADVQSSFTAYNIIVDDAVQTKKYLKKMKDANVLSNHVIDYCEDVLLSVAKNGLLITHGADDTYGSFYAQLINNVRPDVQIISLELMQSEHYRNRLANEGIKIPSANVIDTKFFKLFCEMNAHKSIAVSLTTPKEYFMTDMSRFYLIGLTYLFSPTQIPNLEKNVDLWNSGLKKRILTNKVQYSQKNLVSNYLPMLFQMRKMYRNKGSVAKVNEIDKAIDEIGVQCGKSDKVQKLKQNY